MMPDTRDLPGLHIRSSGAGPTVVTTHGLGDDLEVFADLTDRLTESGYRVVRWDLPGHGASWDVEVADSSDGLAALEHVLARQPHPVILLGHSLGGYLSLAYAARNRDDVSALVLLSTGPGYRNPRSRAGWNTYIGQAAQQMTLAPGAGALAHQHDSTVIDSLPGLTIPVLHMLGGRDRRYRDGAEYMAATLPDSRLATIAGARHSPHRTHADAVGATTLKFLATVSPTRSHHEGAP